MPLIVLRRLALIVAVALFAAPAAAAQTVTKVAAASDLQFALVDVIEAYRRASGAAVDVSFGSSGNIYRQIMQGAPFDVFLSADESFVLDLERAGLTQGPGALYAIGRIAIIAPHGSPLRVDGNLTGLAAGLASGRVEKFAIPNPDHAPYGARAEEALRHAGLWAAVVPRLVLGENVSQAAQFATSGSTQGGIIAYSLALSPNLAAYGDYALIPESWHQPLRQRMVLLKRADAGAQRFYDYLSGRQGRAILARHGFEPPEEDL